MPELLSDSTASEAHSDIDWDAIDEYDGSYTTMDSGVNSPDTSTGGTDDDPQFAHSTPRRPPSDYFPEDNMTEAELSAIMDNYDTKRELEGVRRGQAGCPDILNFNRTMGRLPTPIPDCSRNPSPVQIENKHCPSGCVAPPGQYVPFPG